MEKDLNKMDHHDTDAIKYLKSLNKQSKRSNFLHQIQHKNNYKQEYSLRKWIENYGRKKYLLSFSCLSYDVHKNLLEQRSFSLRDLDFCSESPVYCSKFGESQNTKSILCLGYESGQIYLQKIRKKRKSDEIIVKTGHIDAVYDIAWIPNENSFLSASADSFIILWQLKNEDLCKVQTFFSRSSYVKSVSSNPWDRSVFASGDGDGRIIIWDTRCSNNKIANEIKMAHTHQRALLNIEVIDICPSYLECFSYRKVKIWDLRKSYSTRKRLPHSLWNLSLPTYSGTTSMSLSPFKERIYVSCLNGKIYCFHITTPTIYPVAVYFGFSRYNIHCKSCLSPCGSYLLSGSGDAGAQIWSTNSPGCPIVSLSGHEELVTTVAWGEDDMFVTCDDIKYRIFKCDNASQINLEKEHEDIIGFAESMNEKCFFEESLSQKTGIVESAECVTHGISLTKSTTEERVMKFDTRNFLDTLPQMCLTPSSSKPKSIGEKTPKTEEKGTLLSWLSSSKKTPNSNTDSLLVTPKSGKSPSKSIASKRRLSALLENNQENINEENKKPALSPTKNILSERENRKNRLSTTVKMLKYDDLLEKKEKSESEVSDDDFELINDASHTKDSKFSSLGMDNVCEEPKYPNSGATTPVRSSSINPRTPSHLSPVNTCLLTSPTANLPNYVVDGRSPHNRGESPKIQKREVDWLTSLRKKNSFAKGMEHLIKNGKVKSNRKK